VERRAGISDLVQRRSAIPPCCDPGELAAAIDEHFGSFDAFRAQLGQAAVLVQGSGWGALAFEPLGQRLIVEQIYDHHANLAQGSVPLLVFDVWEHAYYLQYRNVRAGFVEALWNLVNWPDVAERFSRAQHASLA
jgi:Fe-Mn family superoxide dismutase